MWRTLWFNLVTIVLYSAASFGLAALSTDEFTTQLIYGGALVYGFSNVHFVLWFTFYTREKQAAQQYVGAGSQDELFL